MRGANIETIKLYDSIVMDIEVAEDVYFTAPYDVEDGDDGPRWADEFFVEAGEREQLASAFEALATKVRKHGAGC